MNKKIYLIFFFVLIFRLFFAFQGEGYNDDSAYFVLRNVENIKETGKPLFNDELSYGGRYSLFPPLYYYFLSIMNNILGDIAFKIIPSLLFSSLVFLVYFISKEFTEDEDSILFASLISAFIPFFISRTINNISIFSAALFIILLITLSLIKLNNKKYLNLFMGLSILFPLIHNMAFLFILSLFIYFILLIIESKKLEIIKREAILFSLFIILVIGFLFFRDAFLLNGFKVIYQNTPSNLLQNYFSGIVIEDLILNFGLIPLLFGIFGVIYSFIKRKDNTLFLTSMILTTSFLLVFRLINFSLAVIFLGILLSIMSSIGFESFFKYIRLTKFSGYFNSIKYSIFILILIMIVVPSYIKANESNDNVLTDNELSALLWLKEQTSEDSIIMSSHQEGNYITQIAKRKNVIDDNFMLVKNIDQRYNDVEMVFTATSQVKALQALNKYKVSYVYFSDRTKQIYNIDEIAYTDDNCFKEVYRTEGARIYKVRC